eukprot:6360206-Pyramimonas_sp.AAC.1
MAILEHDAQVGPLFVRTRIGGPLGDPLTARGFLGTLSRAVLQWSYSLRQADPSSRDIIAAWSGLAADLKLTKYANDLQKMMLAGAGST